MSLKVVFMGTPEFAVPVLMKLAEVNDVIGVITQPDRPSGRGQRLIQSAVKEYASSQNFVVLQPQDINSPDSLEKIKNWDPDLITVAAFGQILCPELLNIPHYGCLNVHASLLPRWRGAAPINAAILRDDKITGVTIMKMSEGLDDGPILSQDTITIAPEETAGELSDRLSNLGAALLIETIPPYIRGEMDPIDQDHSEATYTRTLKKKDGELDFTQTAESLARTVRAYSPWPGTYTEWNKQRLIIHQAAAVNVTSPGQGVFIINEGLPAIGSANGLLVLESLQLAGKRKLSGPEFLKGAPDW